MRFLIDNMLSTKLPSFLNARAHNAVHVRAVGMGASSDEEILDEASRSGRVVITADRDMGRILAHRASAKPSVVYIRSGVPRDPERLAELIDANLQRVESDLERGAIAVFEHGRIRIAPLPLHDPERFG